MSKVSTYNGAKMRTTTKLIDFGDHRSLRKSRRQVRMRSIAHAASKYDVEYVVYTYDQWYKIDTWECRTHKWIEIYTDGGLLEEYLKETPKEGCQ